MAPAARGDDLLSGLSQSAGPRWLPAARESLDVAQTVASAGARAAGWRAKPEADSDCETLRPD